MSIVKQAFENFADRRESSVWFRGRDKTVSASEIGSCMRKVFYGKHPKLETRNKNHAQGWGAAKRGTVIENYFFLPALRKHYGNKLLYAGSEQKRLTHGLLSATPDGLLIKQPKDLLAELMVPDIGPSREVVVECKTVDPRINLSTAKTEHVFQAQVQMGLFRAVTRHKPDYAVIIYVNASFFDDSLEFVVRYDPEILATAEQRANRIMAATAPEQLRPEGWIAGGSECEYCAFSHACGQLRGNVPDVETAEIDPQFISEMKQLAVAERAVKTKLGEFENRHRDLQEQIKERLRAKNLRRIDANDVHILWTPVKGRPSYDWPGIRKAVQAAGIDLQQFETVGQPSDRLDVKISSTDRLVRT